MKEERKKYEIPSMERNLVELEDGFCAGSATVQNPDADNGRINYQEVNDDFSKAADFSTGSWD
jgi:hypothetical protein